MPFSCRSGDRRCAFVIGTSHAASHRWLACYVRRGAVPNDPDQIFSRLAAHVHTAYSDPAQFDLDQRFRRSPRSTLVAVICAIVSMDE
jgi:hypothetical protein